MDIVGYENYLIYPDGRLWSKIGKGRFLKPGTNNCGYLINTLSNKGKQKPYLIHRLIALHYIPNPENKSSVDHINRIKTDNRIENLRWVTHQENQQNTGISKNNKSGHKNISYDNQKKVWKFQKNINKKTTWFTSKSKRDILCFKFAFIMLSFKRENINRGC